MRKIYMLCVVFGTFASLWLMHAQEKQNPTSRAGT